MKKSTLSEVRYRDIRLSSSMPSQLGEPGSSRQNFSPVPRYFIPVFCFASLHLLGKFQVLCYHCLFCLVIEGVAQWMIYGTLGRHLKQWLRTSFRFTMSRTQSPKEPQTKRPRCVYIRVHNAVQSAVLALSSAIFKFRVLFLRRRKKVLHDR